MAAGADNPTTFAILTFAGSCRDFARASTLQTLRHSAQQNARLLVVDAASNDGAETWLSLLAQRGDIDLIRAADNELARKSGQSQFVVALKSDAFPISADWLDRLRQTIQGGVKAAAITCSGDPSQISCLMLERATLDEMSFDLRGEGHDLAETIRLALDAAGFRIAVLDQPGLMVDASEPREVTVVVGVRARPDEPDRAQNAVACLRSLNLQSAARWRYRIIAVEQDAEPRLEHQFAPYLDRYCFVYNPGPYNRGWGFNVGAWLYPPAGVLCLIDADFLPPRDFIERALEEFARGKQAFLPYQELLYLDAPSTRRVLAGEDPRTGTGQLFRDSQGGTIWISARVYRNIGGHDERFQGWGYGDREFHNRLSRTVSVDRLPERLCHLYHRHREAPNSDGVRANERLFVEIESGRNSPSASDPGNPRRYIAARDWENWHTWGADHIREIVRDEQRHPPQASPRAVLASHLVHLGTSLLDVGCGPGALWSRLWPYRNQITWMGTDVTPAMLSVARREFPDVPVCLSDAAHLPFPAASFDIVLLRHVLEHVPPPLKDAAIAEAMRVARTAVVLNFHLAPSAAARESRRLAGNFLETRWTLDDILEPACAARWRLRERFTLRRQAGENNQVWVFEPPAIGPPSYSNGPRVSIVMPTFRRPHTLLRTIQTVRAQRYSNWELLIVDNAGDGAYQFGDDRIHVHVLTEQASASYARNAAIPYATGDLICFFDDDDDMFPDYLEKFVAAFQANPQAKMVRCGMLIAGVHLDFSHATPECCIRREFATPTWESCGCHDQVYFSGIASRHGWTLENGSIVMIREPLCRANSDRIGGLREGRL